MRSIADARLDARRIVERSLAKWAWADVTGADAERMPLRLALAPPTESDTFDRLDAVVSWASEWQDYSGPGSLETTTRRWRSHGTQTLPVRFVLNSPSDAAAFARLGTTWRDAADRASQLLARWPEMIVPSPSTMGRIVSASRPDWTLVIRFLDWAVDRDLSELLPRQIPIPGVDSKWFEYQRSLLAALRSLGAEGGALDVRDLDKRILVRVLDPTLRRAIGGLGEFDAAASELARLDWHPTDVIICENAQCAFSFGDREGTVLVAKQGYAVDVYGRISWLRAAAVRYWGDLDTHGFAILDRLRHHVPDASSVLMDTSTLLDHRTLWALESTPIRHPLQLLTEQERSTYAALVSGEYGDRVRLEQERIPWAVVEKAFAD